MRIVYVLGTDEQETRATEQPLYRYLYTQARTTAMVFDEGDRIIIREKGETFVRIGPKPFAVAVPSTALQFYTAVVDTLGLSVGTSKR